MNLLDSQVLSTKNNDIQGYPSHFLIFGSSNTWPVVVFFFFGHVNTLEPGGKFDGLNIFFFQSKGSN